MFYEITLNPCPCGFGMWEKTGDRPAETELWRHSIYIVRHAQASFKAELHNIVVAEFYEVEDIRGKIMGGDPYAIYFYFSWECEQRQVHYIGIEKVKGGNNE